MHTTCTVVLDTPFDSLGHPRSVACVGELIPNSAQINTLKLGCSEHSEYFIVNLLACLIP